MNFNINFKLTVRILIFTILIIFNFKLSFSQGWTPLGSGTNAVVRAINSDGNSVFAGGDFTNAGGVGVHYVAEWYNSGWRVGRYGIGTDGPVNALFCYGQYVGGFFSHAGGDTMSCIASNYGRWRRMGLNGGVYAFGSYTDTSMTIVAGGEFTGRYVGDTSFHHIAQFRGYSMYPWWQMSGGTNNSVFALTTYNGQLVAGGSFTTAGGVTVNHIAKWGGTFWYNVASGTNGTVLALTVYNGELIAGGTFTTAGGITANYIAKWNGSNWSSLGSGTGNGMNGDVKCLTVYRGNLIAGGSFYRAGGVMANAIAKWNGSTWSPLGSGMSGYVNAVDSYPTIDSTGKHYTLYAGGLFNTAGGISANNIARWTETDTSVKLIKINKSNLNKPIPPNGTVYDSASRPFYNISSSFVNNVSVNLDSVLCPVSSDLEVELIHQSVDDTLIYNTGDSDSNYTGTTLDDNGMPLSLGFAPFTGFFKPYKTLSQFNNHDPGSNWILKIHNKGTGTGTLKAWTLNIAYSYNPIGITPVSSDVPKSFSLRQNYPNPFNPGTVINFNISSAVFVNITVYDILGREVKTLVNEQLMPGTYKTDWNAENFVGGIYFYKMRAGNYSETRKMVLLK